jgi:putative addiction module killer protein
VNTLQQTTVFAEWLDGLRDKKAKARIIARIEAARLGNFGDCEPVGDGVSEMRIDVGAGYRAYYMRQALIVYLLLCGGDKSTQRSDIGRARKMAKQLNAAKTASPAKAATGKRQAKAKAKPNVKGKAKLKEG